MSTELTREIIEKAFDEVGRPAADRGIVVEIAVYGGSCLILASDIRNASGDVDAVFLVEGKAVREIADHVAARLGLPGDWINEGVKRMARRPATPNRTSFWLESILERRTTRSSVCGCTCRPRPACW